MRGTRIGLFVAWCVGCSSLDPAASAETPPAAPAAPPERARRAPRAADEGDVAASAAKPAEAPPDAQAVRAYVAATEAYAAKDAAAYFTAFADPMTCFYGERDRPRAALEDARRPYFSSEAQGTGPLATMAIEPVQVSADEVLLVHWGVHRDGPGEELAYPLFQRKWIVMTPVDGQWKIAAEFSWETSRRCYDGELAPKPPPCIRSMGKCMTSCCKVGESSNCENCERQCAELYEACSTQEEPTPAPG